MRVSNFKTVTFLSPRSTCWCLGREAHGMRWVCVVIVGTLSTFVEDENENEIMTWHALGHWDENIVFGAKIES